MSDALDRTSCISHRQSVHFFVMYDDFLDIAKISEHQHKLAAFWRVLETKTNERIIYNEGLIKNAKENGLPIPETDLWIEISYSEFSKRTLGVYKESSFKIAAVESERLGFSKSNVKQRPINPLDPNSKQVDCKEYLLLTGVMQSVLNGGEMPTPVEFDSPLLNGYEKREKARKERKEKEKEKNTPVENDSPPVEFDRHGVENDSPPVEFDQFNNIVIESSSIEENKEKRNVSTDTADADVSTTSQSHSENEASLPEEVTQNTEEEKNEEVSTPTQKKITPRRSVGSGKKKQASKEALAAILNISEIPSPKKPDPTTHAYNVALFIELADYYRGCTLTESNDPRTRYQKALQSAMNLVQRKAPFEQVDKLFCFMTDRGAEIGLLPGLKDTKWIEGHYNTDLWTVEGHFTDKSIECDAMERLLRHGTPKTPPSNPNTSSMAVKHGQRREDYVESEQARKTRERLEKEWAEEDALAAQRGA